MALDPSIVLAGKPAPSPLQSISDVLQVQGQIRQSQQQEQALQAQRALDQSMQQAINPDGSFNRDVLRQGVIQKGFGHVWPQIDKQLTEADKARADLADTQAKTDALKLDYGGALAASVKAMNYDPGAFLGALNMARAHGVLSDPAYQAAIQAVQQDPSNIQKITDSMLAQSPKQSELANAKVTAEARQAQAQTGAARLLAEMPGIQSQNQTRAADATIKAQEAAGTVGGLTPYQQAEVKSQQQSRAISAGQLAVAQQRERREAAQDVGVSLTPQGLDIAAENFAKTGQLPPMGMGKQGAAVRSAIINRAAQLHPDLDLASSRAGFAANEGSLKKLQQQRDAISAFENTALKNIDVFLDTAGKVVDTGSPMANAVARAISGKALGSSNQAAYDAARQTALNEVAKIVSNPNLSGQLSDSARKEIEAFNPNSATLKQSVAVMRVLKQDMANRAQSYDQQIAEIKGRIGGKAGAEPPKATLRFNPATGKLEPIK